MRTTKTDESASANVSLRCMHMSDGTFSHVDASYCSYYLFNLSIRAKY